MQPAGVTGGHLDYTLPSIATPCSQLPLLPFDLIALKAALWLYCFNPCISSMVSCSHGRESSQQSLRCCIHVAFTITILQRRDSVSGTRQEQCPDDPLAVPNGNGHHLQ